jgi:predicted Rossmann fold nucleotide-binding protein DprA/Smf involved in DNA uptake
MNIARFYQGTPGYPSALQEHFGDLAPAVITARGNLEILTGRTQDSPLLALFCSVRCPGNLILQTYDFVQRLRQMSITVIGGFHLNNGFHNLAREYIANQ